MILRKIDSDTNFQEIDSDTNFLWHPAAMLFDPARHEPLKADGWEEARALAAMRVIVDDAQQALGTGITWPMHPSDQKEGSSTVHKSLYLGSTGTLWALAYLQRQGAVRLRIEPAALIERIHKAYLEQPDTGEVVPSYFLGEVGIEAVRWRLTQLPEAANRLHAAIERNIPNPVNEALWAAPGTMLGALHMHEWTGDAAWERLYLANVEQVWSTWQPSPSAHCHLWTQHLYGEVVQLLGAGHGFAGNAYALLRGARLLPAERREALYDRCVETLSATVEVEGDCANWPPGVGTPREGREKTLVQWCHGAPGIVTAMKDFPAGRSPAMDEMLLRAGNLIWKAGPLAKGHGLCHGTAGNGYALLALHRRSGDAEWLVRARAFAMHAIGQAERMGQAFGRGRYALWTGDPGLAVYLWHCVNAADGMPSLDTLAC